MNQVYAFLADGLEETELLAVADVLIRGGVKVELISVTGNKEVVSSHNIRIIADREFSEINCDDADVLFLPGGMPGTRNLAAHKGLCDALLTADRKGKRIAAICAAPSVLGGLGILKGRRATCYPGFEKELEGAVYTKNGVVTDGHISTGRGLGYALDLGIELLGLLTDRENGAKIKESIQYDQI